MLMKSLSQLDPHSKLFIALSDRKITSKMMPQTNLTKKHNFRDDIWSVLVKDNRSKMKAFNITLIILGLVSVSKY